jgi:hypothetical protein
MKTLNTLLANHKFVLLWAFRAPAAAGSAPGSRSNLFLGLPPTLTPERRQAQKKDFHDDP